MKHEVIDNFLDEEYFDSLVTLFTKLPWSFQPTVTLPKGQGKGTEKEEFFYMIHRFYNRNLSMSPYYDALVSLLKKFNIKSLLRIKANLYPNTHILQEHPMHEDYDFSHFGCILSMNTCDGYTKLKDGTKIDSVANRVLLFDPSKEHCSTTTTNVPARINININYM